jgi:hypothetical protein
MLARLLNTLVFLFSIELAEGTTNFRRDISSVMQSK